MFTAWRTSSYSQATVQGECVEVGLSPGQIGVRDTRNRTSGQLAVSRRAFRDLVSLAKRG